MSFETDMDNRIEVYVPGGQQLLLRPNDLTVARLSQVFKIKPESIFLEEDVTNNAEFPSNGKFDLNIGLLPGKYKVCGEQCASASAGVAESGPAGNASVSQQRPHGSRISLPSASTSMDWGQVRPWQSALSRGSMQGPNALLRKKPKYDVQLKRSIPFVSLCSDQSGKKMIIDTIFSNIYVKVQESDVSLQSILNDVAPKVDLSAEELVLLDSTLIPLHPDEQRDIEYWRVPSRKFYITKLDDYEQLKSIIQRKKRSTRKRSVGENHVGEDANEQIDHIETNIKKIADDMDTVKKHSQIMLRLLHLMDCKICKNVPTNAVLVLCCNQVLGCHDCFNQSIQDNNPCPLCRATSPQCVPIKGYDALFEFLRGCSIN